MDYTPRSLRALLIEDSVDDAQLIVRALTSDGFEVQWERADSPAAVEAALTVGSFDIILADCRLPNYRGLDVLSAVGRRQLDIPVIVVSGTIGEEAAADAMRAGARDFVSKERLARLAPAVRRELTEAAFRREARAAEAELRMHQQRFQSLVERSTEVIAVMDRDGTMIYCSPTTERVLGYATADYVGHNAFEFIHPEDMPLTQTVLDRLLASAGGVERVTIRARHKEGHWIWMEVAATNLLDDPAVRGVVLNYRDITARRNAEEALQDREALYRATFDESPIGICHASLSGRMSLVNEELARFLGFTREELLGVPFTDVTAPEDTAADLAGVRRLVAGEVESDRREKQYVRKDGSRVWGLRTVSVRRDAAGKPLHLIAIVQDINDRKLAELALQQLQHRHEAILNHSPALIYLKDLEGRFILTNRLFEQKFVVEGDSALGRTAREIFSGRFADADATHDRAALASDGPVTQEITIYERDGAHVYFSIKFALRDASGRAYAVGGIASDISDRKRIEQQFLQAQKMEAFGQLAGGVAHDFNNILAVQLMHFNLLALDPDLPAKAKSILKELEQAANRATSLVRQLLIFSRRHELVTQVLDLNRAVDGVCKMLKRFVGEDIAFTFEPAPQPLWADADPGMIEQVVMNLCVNARDAMPRGGKLTISLRVERRRAIELDGPDAPEADYAAIVVTDTGHGMDEQTRKRIFEPFFTTKPVGRGTGLGLATVHGIARQHRGWVDVDSAPHAGSTFRVYFPLTKAAAANVASTENEFLHGTGRILLAEDEETVRSTAAACLRRAGYEVTEVSDGVQAMMRWDETRGDFDLLVTDMVMPGGLSGLQVAEQLLRAKAELKAVLMTGYNPEQMQGPDADPPNLVRMSKPFSATRLLQTVHDALARK